MKRTHVRHDRDNRRPHYYAQRDHRDTRPVLAWIDREDGARVMSLNGKAVAFVKRLRGMWQAWILPRTEAEPADCAADHCDDARLFCEAHFAALNSQPSTLN